MENASKALIIAGAILISILLITIGIVLINSGRDVVDTGTAGMTSQKIQTFNSQFTAYEGTRKGTELRNIFNTVKASNATDESHQVEFTGINKVADLVSTKNYDVTLEYATEDGDGTEKGYVYEILIEEAD